MRKNINNKIEKFLLGFASGVMIAASVWCNVWLSYYDDFRCGIGIKRI